MKCQMPFSTIRKNIINLSSAKLAHRVEMVIAIQNKCIPFLKIISETAHKISKPEFQTIMQVL